MPTPAAHLGGSDGGEYAASRRLAALTNARGDLKKKPQDFCRTPGEVFAALETLRAGYPLEVLCETLQVSKSGYYAWRSRKPSIMPPLANLDDQNISDVLTYVRQCWSNDAATVSKEAVAELRAKYKERAAPWTATELGE